MASNVNGVKGANSVEIGEADALAECRKFLEWGKGCHGKGERHTTEA